MKLIRYQNPITGWSSFDRLSPLRDLLDSAFALAGTSPGISGEHGWIPALDIHEDAESLTVSLEAPGLKKEDFDIALQDDTLTVSGERKVESESREGESFRSERAFGTFSRTIQLPSAIQPDAVSAEYVDGILRVVLPKAEEAKPRKIEVSVK